MLTISREAAVKVGKHAWNVFPLEAFGFLLGSKAESTVYAALPCSKTQRWNEFEDRWIGIEANLEKARSVAKSFDMEVVGFYATTDDDHYENFPMPPFVGNASMELVMVYRANCCPGCSWSSYKYDNRWLKRGEDYVVPHGKRISDSISQKRILTEWHRIYAAVDYSNQSVKVDE
ncbi:MAG: hypothetical protein HOP01_07545 [Gallionella sp.]|nr:hypothetical protein [Gallionella sp.]